MELRCSKCGQVKPAEQFCPDNRRPSGYSSHCKACHRAYYKKRPTAKPLKPGDTKRCTKCDETKPVSEFRQNTHYRTGYVSQCKDCQRAMARAWKRRNKQRNQEYQAQWRDENPDYQKEWWKDLPDEIRERYRECKRPRDRARYHTPRGKAMVLHYQHCRRTAEDNGDVPPEWLEYLYATQTHCAYCGCEFDDSTSPTIDHFIPLSKDGAHTKDNIVLCCKSCNSSKHDRIIGNAYISPRLSERSPGFLVGLL